MRLLLSLPRLCARLTAGLLALRRRQRDREREREKGRKRKNVCVSVRARSLVANGRGLSEPEFRLRENAGGVSEAPVALRGRSIHLRGVRSYRELAERESRGCTGGRGWKSRGRERERESVAKASAKPPRR